MYVDLKSLLQLSFYGERQRYFSPSHDRSTFTVNGDLKLSINLQFSARN